MDIKLIGGTLLVIGTSIGGGMLALPIATAQAGFLHSTLLLFGCWFVMTAGAFLLLEANLWLPENSNIISMARATLGTGGQIIAWVTYLLLLYSLLAAYMAGGADFLNNLLGTLHFHLPEWLACLLFAGLLGYVVYHGIRSVDLVNRVLMFGKLGAFLILLILVLPYVLPSKLEGGDLQYITASTTVALTSFGFSTIVPSLRTYFNHDVKKLRLVILLGSLIPLMCYILWDLAIMGVIPREGAGGLIEMQTAGHSTSEFVNELSRILDKSVITGFARFFTSICLATSFLGVALCLADFLADGLGLEKHSKHDWVIYSATFGPPLLIVLFSPGIFISALSYAGVYCTVLLILLPALMVWVGRYRKSIASGYRVMGGKPLLAGLILISILIIVQSVIEKIA